MSKVTRKGFYSASDTYYFRQHGRALFNSIARHAPWAHCHAHIWDATESDLAWCRDHAVSVTHSATPEQLITLEQRKDYWVCARFALIPELYQDDVALVALDSDCLFRAAVTEAQFDHDLQHSWSANREYKNLPFKAQGSSVGFAARDPARHQFQQKLQDHQPWRWDLDQQLLDEMVAQGQMRTMTMRYGDYFMRPENPVWSGKGDRKQRSPFKQLQDCYQDPA